MKFAQTYDFETVTFHLTCGDIFDTPVEAIVNSEQTDFVLSFNPNTISGQLRAQEWGTGGSKNSVPFAW